MSELRDYKEQHPELEDLSEEEIASHLEKAGDAADAEYEAWRERDEDLG